VTGNKLSVILPTLNEAGNIGPLIREIRAVLPECQVIVVDDASCDGTPERVDELITAGDGRLRLVRRTGRPCLTESIQAGVRLATTDYVAWMDADFSHPPNMLPKLLDEASKSDCAIASRFIIGASRKDTRDSPDSFLAAILSVAMNVLVRYWLRLKVSDYTSGFIVCRTSLIRTHDFVGDYGEYFIELMHFLSHRGTTIIEIPYASPPRQWGESKTGNSISLLFRRGIKYLWIAFRLRLPRSVFGQLSLRAPDCRTPNG
jgi:dolichol-phosphate mannosyltransferase